MIDIKNIARIYSLPARCAITKDDLEQEGWLAILEREAELGRKLEDNEAYATARWAMQQAIDHYAGPVSRANPEEGMPVTETLASEEPTPAIPPEMERYLDLIARNGDRSPLLSTNEHFVITHFYGLDLVPKLTPLELAAALELTVWAVYKLLDRATVKLRKAFAPTSAKKMY